MDHQAKTRFANLGMLGVSALFGITIPLMKMGLEGLSPFFFNAVRFTLASLPLLVWGAFRRPLPSSTLIGASFICGLFLFLGYSLQILGVALTRPSLASFLSGFFVILTPLITWVWLRTGLERKTIIGVILAFAGLAIMSGSAHLSLGQGEWLVLLGAFGFAGHIVAVSAFRVESIVQFTALQLFVVALLSLFCAFAFGEQTSGAFAVMTQKSLIVLLVLAFFSTALSFALQIGLQRYTDPTHTAVAFSLEPLWGVLFSWVMLGDKLTSSAALGGVFIVMGVLVIEVPIKRRQIALRLAFGTVKNKH